MKLGDIRPRCNPPEDCFLCKYEDCAAGMTKRETTKEIEYRERGLKRKRGRYKSYERYSVYG